MSLTIGPTRWHQICSYAKSPLGTNLDGGYLICRNGAGTSWIIAPQEAEVSRSYYSASDAITVAQSITGCQSGWFLPDINQLSLTYSCIDYWDSYSNDYYWSTTPGQFSGNARRLSFDNGTVSIDPRNVISCVRAIRSVTY